MIVELDRFHTEEYSVIENDKGVYEIDVEGCYLALNPKHYTKEVRSELREALRLRKPITLVATIRLE